mmetsp:Transcript_3310/g.8648  ORF Transcript_3310/g.8648 Transcript_3310/m.8648 type:complete len:139 (+) Transcript_3310:197-613(+)
MRPDSPRSAGPYHGLSLEPRPRCAGIASPAAVRQAHQDGDELPRLPIRTAPTEVPVRHHSLRQWSHDLLPHEARYGLGAPLAVDGSAHKRRLYRRRHLQLEACLLSQPLRFRDLHAYDLPQVCLSQGLQVHHIVHPVQ